MKKKKFKKIFGLALIAGIVAFNVNFGLQQLNQSKTSGLTLANIEMSALADEVEKPKLRKYQCQHFKCYNIYGNETGKWSASSYESPNGNLSKSHNHQCRDCSSAK
jgi:hypothetical protein